MENDNKNTDVYKIDSLNKEHCPDHDVLFENFYKEIIKQWA
jgi:hypothetical protein